MSDNPMIKHLWVPWTYQLGDGATLSCELKRMDALEAPDFKSNLAEAFAVLQDLFRLRVEVGALVEPPADATQEEKNAHQDANIGFVNRMQKLDARFFKSLDREVVTRALRECVRNVSGLEIEGQTTTGETMLLDPDLLKAVLIELRRLTDISATEGKASSSPSTSVSEASEPPSIDSPAPSIVPEDSTAPSTVQETLAETA